MTNPSVEAERRCPNCGNVIPGDLSVCSVCGRDPSIRRSKRPNAAVITVFFVIGLPSAIGGVGLLIAGPRDLDTIPQGISLLLLFVLIAWVTMQAVFAKRGPNG